jgi:hypothetical protein
VIFLPIAHSFPTRVSELFAGEYSDCFSNFRVYLAIAVTRALSPANAVPIAQVTRFGHLQHDLDGILEIVSRVRCRHANARPRQEQRRGRVAHNDDGHISSEALARKGCDFRWNAEQDLV